MTTYTGAPGPGLPGQRMTPEQLMHFYAGMIARALEQNRLRPIVVPLFDGPQLRAFAIHLEVGVPAERVEKIASAVALAAHSSTCRIARDHGKLLVEVPKAPEERRKLGAAAVERFKPPTSWHVALGLSVTGQPVWYDLDDPHTAHLAIGGTTGSGKTVALRSLLYRLAVQNPPAQLGFVMVDKKGHDLAPYFGKSAHLRHPIVSNPFDGARLLAWATGEMDRRLAANQREPKLVVVIEEIGDLLMVNGEVEGFLARIAQVGRAAGVHLVLVGDVDQLPSVGAGNVLADVIAAIQRTEDGAQGSGPAPSPDPCGLPPDSCALIRLDTISLAARRPGATSSTTPIASCGARCLLLTIPGPPISSWPGTCRPTRSE